MLEPSLFTMAFVSAFCGMSWLALAMKPHWVQVRGDGAPAAPPSRRLRTFGASSLLISLMACLAADHLSMACLVWVMTLSATALLVAMTLSYAPRVLSWLSAVGRAHDAR